MLARVGGLAIKVIITNFALSNYLGPERFGILNYPMAIVTFFIAIAALGLDGFVTRELLSDPEKKRYHIRYSIPDAFDRRYCDFAVIIRCLQYH